MKYIITYEKLKSMDNYKNMTYNDAPNVDDFVICKMKDVVTDSDETIKFKYFINNNIGQIILINNHRIIIKYENIPNEISSYFGYSNGDATYVYLHDIKYYSNKKDDLEPIIQSKKYNL